MSTKIRIVSIFFILCSFLLPLGSVSADVGPKPSMHFDFEQDFSGPQVTITSGVLYECEQPNCGDAKPLEELGPQGFSCEAASCSALAYGFSTYHRLEIRFSDGKTRRSNVFETAQFNSSYKVTVSQSSLLVEAVPSLDLNRYWPVILLALGACCLVGIAVVVVVIVLIVRRAARKK